MLGIYFKRDHFSRMVLAVYSTKLHKIIDKKHCRAMAKKYFHAENPHQVLIGSPVNNYVTLGINKVCR